MTVVKFDSVYFDNNISPSVKNAKDDLKKAKSKANSLSVPLDYKYRKYLVNLDDKIKKHMDDLDKFNFEYVSKQIKTIFGIDLKEYNVEVNLQTLKECATELEDDQVIPIYINTKNDIVMVIGVAKQNSKTSLSIVGTYNVQKEPYE